MSSGFIDYIVQIDHYLLMVSHPSCRKSKSPIMFKTKPSADVKCYEKGIWRMVNRIIHSKHQDCFTSWKRPPDIFITFFGPLKEVLKALFKGIHNITKDILKTFLRRFFVFGWLYLLGVKNFLKQKHPRGSGILIGKITWANWYNITNILTNQSSSFPVLFGGKSIANYSNTEEILVLIQTWKKIFIDSPSALLWDIFWVDTGFPWLLLSVILFEIHIKYIHNVQTTS